MKYLVTLICLFLCSCVTAQSKDGIYKSDASSFRQNYFLVKEGARFTLYGWEQDLNGDTIFYKTAATRCSNNYLSFEKFHFSKVPVTKKTISRFVPDKSIILGQYLLHRHFADMRFTKRHISVAAIKDGYDGRADGFRFNYIQ